MPAKPPPHELERRFRAELAQGPTTSPVASRALGISQPRFSRLVTAMRRDVLTVGKARRTQYALRRQVAHLGAGADVFEVDASGGSRSLGVLHATEPRAFFLEATCNDLASGFYPDLPFFLHDMRPAGFLGRRIPRRHPELEVPDDILLWTADHCLAYFNRHGWDLPGAIIVGEQAFRCWLDNSARPANPVQAADRVRSYPQAARDALAGELVGSSAAGEQPKFSATRMPDGRAVLVKFSPPIDDRLGERTKDLLVCEHIAHEVLTAAGHPAAPSQLIEAGGRMFLEVERFDRLPGGGRRGILSLFALDVEFVGRLRTWSETATGLRDLALIHYETYDAILWLELFGRLIANTDMHLGNMSLFAEAGRPIGIAPAYDMLPTLYAPQQGQIVERSFVPPGPGPGDQPRWSSVCTAAGAFWDAVAAHAWVSAELRRMAQQHAAAIARLAGLVTKLPSMRRN